MINSPKGIFVAKGSKRRPIQRRDQSLHGTHWRASEAAEPVHFISCKSPFALLRLGA